MAELTHDSSEDGFHEIQLSGKQLVFLFMATTVVSVVIFLCGVLVGRGVRTERDRPQPVESVAIQPDDEAEGGAPAVAAEGSAPSPDEFTYDNRLNSQAPAEQITPKPQEAPPPAPPVTSEPPAPTPEAKPAAPAAKPPAANRADVPTSGRPGTWFIQVAALRNRDAAADTVRQLVAKGYSAYLADPAAGEPAFYRVRIGRFGNRGEAEQVAQRLQKEGQFKSDIRRY